MILARDDHLSFSIYNRGFDQQEFFVQDRFTLNMWIKALQQHIVDMRMTTKTVFFFQKCHFFVFRRLGIDLRACFLAASIFTSTVGCIRKFV